MPIYEYSCKKCGAIAEALVKNHREKPKLTCKHCKGKNFEKVFSSIGVLKGGSSAPHNCGGSCGACCGMR